MVTMKKLLFSSFLFVLALALSGCVNVAEAEPEALYQMALDNPMTQSVIGAQAEIDNYQISPVTEVAQHSLDVLKGVDSCCVEHLSAGDKIRTVSLFVDDIRYTAIFSVESNKQLCIYGRKADVPLGSNNDFFVDACN